MTCLSGELVIAPFTVVSNDLLTVASFVLRSAEEGRTWEVDPMAADVPLVWWMPCGRPIGTSGGTLTMAVYGAAGTADLEATIHGAGLIRSHDRGRTWGDFSWIVRGPSAVLGAHPLRRFSFEHTDIAPLADGRWLAMVTARRLNAGGCGPAMDNEGPGAPQVLCRLWSTDAGRTWSVPDQLTPGTWPALARVGQETVCANTRWCAWGAMTLLASRDGFQTFHQKIRRTAA